MKHLSLLLLGSVVAACASDPPPPAASSATVDVATNTPSDSTEPVKTDMALAAEADRNAEEAALRPAANPQPSKRDTDPSPQRATEPAPAAVTGNAVGSTPASPPDNSKVNQRDRSGDTLTAADQGGGEADRKLTQQVRQAVMKDGSLSFTAKNVKIITVNGKVTLRGPVNNEAERAAIDAAAKKIAGAGQVENLLEIKK